jgi:hypothetical protein
MVITMAAIVAVIILVTINAIPILDRRTSKKFHPRTEVIEQQKQIQQQLVEQAKKLS